jgi:hypothetical protein
MPAQKKPPIDIDFEKEITDRIKAIINKKLEDNHQAVARLGNAVSNWRKIGSKLGLKMNAERDLLKDEKNEIKKTEKLLNRSTCDGVDKRSFGIAGKIVDPNTKLSLPGLTVRIAPSGKRNIITEVRSDKFGNFAIKKKVNELVQKLGNSKKLTFTVVSPSRRIIHTEDISIQPKKGAVKNVSLKVVCTGRLSELVKEANIVKESIENDKNLLEEKIKSTTEAQNNFDNLSKTTKLFVRNLKKEIAVKPPVV